MPARKRKAGRAGALAKTVRSLPRLLGRSSEKVKKLREVPILAGLSQRELGIIASEADVVEVDPGEVLTRQGGAARDSMLILKGSARVERNGRRIARLREGDCFGEMSLLDGRPRSATVVAERPTSVLVIPARSFARLLQDVPGLARRILVQLSQRLREADEELSKRN
jgi:CRP-like cAMP-binding protein